MPVRPPLEDDGGEKLTKRAEEETKRKESLFETIETETFPVVQGKLTVKTIMSCGRNPLLVAIEVREKLDLNTF